ncbi:hypothetical protein RYX36_005945 [Vicia faba]
MEFDCLQSNKVPQKLIENSALDIDIVDPKSNSKEISNTKSESVKGENFKGKLKLKLKKGIKGSATGLNQSSDSGDVVDAVRRSITDLPPALISEILNCLDPKDLGIVSCVSSILRSLASEHHAWKGFYYERWGLPEPLGVGDEKSWKEIFVEREFRSSQNKNTEVRLWGHDGPVTSLALDLTRIYSGSWDTTVRVWDRLTTKCIVVLRHSDWVWGLVPHDTTVVTTSGSDLYVWDTNSGTLVSIVPNAHVG